MSDKKFEILPMKDLHDSYRVKKDILPDLPMRLGITGKSDLAGKSTLLGNLICRFYADDFQGEDIYLVSPSAYSDMKLRNMCNYKKVPLENIFNNFNENELEVLYDHLKEVYEKDVKEEKIPTQKLVIFDDCGADPRKTINGTVDKMAFRGRHYNISVICIVQRYTMLSPVFRENLSALICFGCTQKQIEFITDEHNTMMDKKQFMKIFKQATKEKHSFFFINYCSPPEKRFMRKFEEYLEIE